MARLRLLVTLQDEIATRTSDDLPALLMLVANRAQELTGSSGALVEITESGGSISRAATGSARAPELPGALLRPRGQDGHKSAVRNGAHLQADAERHFDESSQVSVPVSSSQQRFGFLAVMSPAAGPFQAEKKQILRIIGGVVGTRLEHLEQLRERDVLLTEKAIALATLRDSESRFRNAFDNSGVGMALVAPDGRWLKVNVALCRTLGFDRTWLLSHDVQSVSHPEDVGTELEFIAGLLDGERASHEVEKRYIHSNGSIVWGLLTVSVVKDELGQPLYFVWQIQDISARKQAEAVLERLAIRDSLTGLLNRGEMDRLLDEEIARARRHSRALSLVMVDVDRFKQVNDTCGHQEGDRALKQVARVLASCVRSHDQVARYGGEEFAIILPETTGHEALAVAERMRARVAAEIAVVGRVSDGEIRVPVTISVGIATVPGDANIHADQLLRDADKGLYAAKHGGRNRCVVIASGSAPIDC